MHRVGAQRRIQYSKDPVGDSSICAHLVFPEWSDLASVPWLVGSGDALAGLGAGEGAGVSRHAPIQDFNEGQKEWTLTRVVRLSREGHWRGLVEERPKSKAGWELSAKPA